MCCSSRCCNNISAIILDLGKTLDSRIIIFYTRYIDDI
jgi:hypothetical protein